MPRLPRHIYKRGNRYYLRITLNGREHRKSLGDRLDEAKRRAAININRLRSGEELTPEPLPEPSGTLEGLIDSWLKDVAPATRSEDSIANARHHLKTLFMAACPADLADVRTPQLRALRASMEARRRKPMTVASAMSNVRCFLNWCLEAGHIERSPWVRGLMPRLAQRAPDRLFDAQVDAILAKAGGADRFEVLLALGTGMRRSELVDLHRRHVVERPEPHVLLEVTKSGKIRRVPLDKDLWDALQAHLKTHDDIHVIANRARNAQPVIRRIDVGFHWHWHQLRHTFACRYLEDGGSLQALQLILGHASVKTTEIYARISDRAMFDDAARVGKARRGGTIDGTPEGIADTSLAQEQ